MPAKTLTAPDEEELAGQASDVLVVFQHLDNNGVRFTTTEAPGTKETSIRQIVAALVPLVWRCR